MSLLSANEILTLVEEAGIPAGYRTDLILEHKGVEWITKLIEHLIPKDENGYPTTYDLSKLFGKETK